MLPDRVIDATNKINSSKSPDLLVFENPLEISKSDLPPTPVSWHQTVQEDFLYVEPILKIAVLQALIASGSGTKPQQFIYQRGGGGFLHSIIPELLKAMTQTSAGFGLPLTYHIEDTVLNYAAQILSLSCVRNDERVPSFFVSIKDINFEKHKKLEFELSKAQFNIAADDNYKGDSKFIKQNVAVICGKGDSRSIRMDMVEMAGIQVGKHQEDILSEFNDLLSEHMYSFIPSTGDIVILSNETCLHGRSNFSCGITPEGTPCEKRWLLRLLNGYPIIHPYFDLEHSFSYELPN
jgi:hypothetical protein